MEEHHLPLKKFSKWIRDLVSADPPFSAEKNYSTKDLQKKFSKWFRDPVSADPPLPAEENRSTGELQKKFSKWFRDPVSVDPPFPAVTNHSIRNPLRKLIAGINNIIMRVESKFRPISLLIGMSAIVLLLTGMLIPPRVAALQPTETATAALIAHTSTPALISTSTIHSPTSTFTPTPTLIRPTSTATATDIATSTPTFSNTLIWSLREGYLSQVGPLELGDQIKVYESSLKYVRTSPYKGRRLGEYINGPGYGAPSNICGPLSISILQEAGIINRELNPHDYWMLNPDDLGARKLLTKAFPPEKFRSSRIRVKLDEIDWNVNPLYPGDFVYIYAGSGGNFEHMLVVNRVDSQGRAYAVTNHNTENGFIISEVLLYDPDRSDLGMFSTWTVWPNAELGSTGFGGFEVWRMRTP